jgi:prepilin-type N-terminal cleavage/methylation domain-containing protein
MGRTRAYGARRGGFTLIEVITAITISSMVMVSLVAMFKLSVRGVTVVVDRTDLEMQGRGALETIQARLIESVPSAINNRYKFREFLNIPNAWDNNGFHGAFHFFADINGDGIFEWVWVWVDEGGAADQKGDIYPRPPFLKMTAFQLYPTRPDRWADYDHQFFKNYINNNPNCYYILASNLTRRRNWVISGTTVSLEQGFGGNPGNGDNWLDLKIGMSIDRDGGGYSQGEPVTYLCQRVNMENHGNPVNNLPDPLYVTDNLAAVRDSAFPLPANSPKGRALLER